MKITITLTISLVLFLFCVVGPCHPVCGPVVCVITVSISQTGPNHPLTDSRQGKTCTAEKISEVLGGLQCMALVFSILSVILRIWHLVFSPCVCPSSGIYYVQFSISYCRCMHFWCLVCPLFVYFLNLFIIIVCVGIFSLHTDLQIFAPLYIVYLLYV